MKNKYLSTVLFAAMALSPLAVTKAASLIGINYGSSLNANVETGANLNTNLNQADSDTSVDSGVNLNSNLNTAIEGDIMTVRRADLENESNQNVGVSIDARDNINLDTRSVATQEDLRVFARSAIASDENLNSMSFANDEVVVSYTARGRFVGIVPVMMDVDVKVDQGGRVEFDYPWYSFLVVKDTEDLKADIQSEVDAKVSSEAGAGWTNFDRAELAASIAETLRAHYELSTATSTDEEV